MAKGSVLLADVNGRDLALALVSPGEAPRGHRDLACPSLKALEEHLIDAVSEHSADGLIGAAVCGAGPEIDGAIALTAGDFTLTQAWLRAVLKTPRVSLLNDFAACALGAPRLAPSAMRLIHEGKPGRNAQIAVIGPNLGLGVAALTPHRTDGWTPVVSEGGHIDFTPGEPREVPVFEALQARHGRVSAEHFLSQQGLADIYAALGGGLDGSDEVILAWVRDGDETAREALSIFSALLGAFAGDAALSFAARGGVYINSPLMERIDGLLDQAAFSRRFEDKGRMSAYLKDIPVYLAVGRCTLLGLSALFTASDLRYEAAEVKVLDC
ncbi:glucokinase [Caulobacter sp. SL161]|uniref:glucokinase n=1 Tax=Caulobacter sp. SL161 TaxID=2995156 RepID=UPI002273D42D|nr:glucokinase [Caulobacter sp. SL161]MCY1649050.1 glucokinase [Caulobacter sp. SL161]